uniref:Uncharacterized protein n=1 Tax=Brassica oleracea var. oleracea TaxID=109376 RepID=A0A0D3E8E5_BRAOL
MGLLPSRDLEKEFEKLKKTWLKEVEKECSTSSHLKVNKSLRKCTRKISFPCMTLRSVLANLMLVSGTCISEDEQGFPDPTEKERECFEDLEYSYLPDQASEYRKSVIFSSREFRPPEKLEMANILSDEPTTNSIMPKGWQSRCWTVGLARKSLLRVGIGPPFGKPTKLWASRDGFKAGQVESGTSSKWAGTGRKRDGLQKMKLMVKKRNLHLFVALLVIKMKNKKCDCFPGILRINRSLVLSHKVSATSVGTTASEVIVYKEIAGGPIFDLYDDDGWIQYNDNKFDGHEVDNLGDEVSLEKIRFLLVEGNSLEIGNSRSNDCGTSWALKKTGPIRAFTHNRNDEHMDIPSSTLMLITWVKAKGEQIN